jgi:hypothetical protein
MKNLIVWCSAGRVHIVGLVLTAVATSAGWASTARTVQDRLDSDITAGKPVVVHVVVALCDNVNQGIIPVPEALGNGQDPKTNLYWGARYGVRTHLLGAAGWTRIDAAKPDDPRVLDRVVLHTNLKRDQTSVPVYVVADGWDGLYIRDALQAYLRMAAGGTTETVEVGQGSGALELRAGGASHMLAYVGHNGLMDFSLEPPVFPHTERPARSAIVLACASKSYFLAQLQAVSAHPLLLTTGLMAPEAYTLDSAIRTWVEQRTTSAVVHAAASAYDRYQHCGLTAARRLFWGEP